MKFLLLSCAAVLMLSLSLQCSRTPEKAGDTKEHNSTSKINANSQSENYAELKRRYMDMESELKAASRKLGVENPEAISGTNEIRVWVGFGVTHPRLLILQLSGEQRATYLTFTHEGNKVEGTPTKATLGPPKSGWDELEKFLKEQGIGSPLGLSQESSQYVRSPDVQVIVIEVKVGDYYGMVYFHLDNTEEDAQRALTVCRRIESEFDIKMYCGP